MIEVKERQTELTLDVLLKMFGIEKKDFSSHFLEARFLKGFTLLLGS